jgi:hypothetical protein
MRLAAAQRSETFSIFKPPRTSKRDKWISPWRVTMTSIAFSARFGCSLPLETTSLWVLVKLSDTVADRRPSRSVPSRWRLPASDGTEIAHWVGSACVAARRSTATAVSPVGCAERDNGPRPIGIDDSGEAGCCDTMGQGVCRQQIDDYRPNLDQCLGSIICVSSPCTTNVQDVPELQLVRGQRLASMTMLLRW